MLSSQNYAHYESCKTNDLTRSTHLHIALGLISRICILCYERKFRKLRGLRKETIPEFRNIVRSLQFITSTGNVIPSLIIQTNCGRRNFGAP
jgi:hypothetical protein